MVTQASLSHLRTLTALGGAIALAAFAVPASATTAQSGSLNVVANSTINGSTVSSVENKSWAAVPTNLNASAGAEAFAPSSIGPLDHITTTGVAAATWASADAGSVRFTGYGWDFEVFDPANSGDGSNLTENRGGEDWDYTFTATGNGLFTMNYAVAAHDNPFGLWGWSIDWSGPGGGLPVSDPFDPTTSGVFTRALVAGQTYTIGLNGNPNVSFGGISGSDIGSMDGAFDWTISTTSVPEPALWALMIGGFGLVGMTLRRRRDAFA